MKIALFCGSLRKDSLNKKLLLATQRLLPQDTESEFVDLKPLSLPVYDGDIEAENFPSAVRSLGEKLKSADAWIVVSPEYNGSISSPLKNTIDWLSRLKPHPFEKKPVLLMAATPGGMAGIRALLHSRRPFESLGAYVFPQTFGLAKAHEAFNPDGTLTDSKNQERLRELLKDYADFASKLG